MAIDWWCAHCGRRRVTFKTKHCGGCGRSIWANRPAGVWPNTAVPRTDQTNGDPT